MAMDEALKLWIVILGVSVVNYLMRISFIAIFSRRKMPPLLARAIRYVPAAMVTALVVPMIITPAGPPGVVAQADLRVVAAIVAALVALRTRSTLKTLIAGMGALWIFQAVIPLAG